MNSATSKKPTIALWFYRNDGGEEVQQQLKETLENRGYCVINEFDMRECYCLDGQVTTKDGYCLSNVDVFYHMNADERTPHQQNMLKALEMSGVRVVNSWSSFSLSQDKFCTNLLLRKSGITVPDSVLITAANAKTMADLLFSKWGSVCYKPREGHGGQGIMKFDSPYDLIDFIGTTQAYLPNYYFEQYIPFGSHDFRVEIFQNQIIGGYSRTKTHPFKTNISSGGIMTPLALPPACQEIALDAAKVLDIDFTIIDLIQSEINLKYYVLEVNALMGIFVESGMRWSPKTQNRTPDPSYANDSNKLNILADYLAHLASTKNDHHITSDPAQGSPK